MIYLLNLVFQSGLDLNVESQTLGFLRVTSMRRIEDTGQFKRDFKREAKGTHRAALGTEFLDVIMALANDLPLEEKHRDTP